MMSKWKKLPKAAGSLPLQRVALILHLALAIRNRGYTNVGEAFPKGSRLRGLTQINVLNPRRGVLPV
jgi:hypothetical protein